MKIASTLNFAGSPERVALMLVDPDFSVRLGEEAEALNVETSCVPNGLVTTYSLATPDSGVVRTVLGPQMTWTQTLVWDPVNPDGTRPGRLTMTLSGVPAGADGTLLVSPAPAGSTVAYESDLTVRIPLAGPKLEQLAAGYLRDALSAIQRAGDIWLA